MPRDRRHQPRRIRECLTPEKRGSQRRRGDQDRATSAQLVEHRLLLVERPQRRFKRQFLELHDVARYLGTQT
jgi:hypothetical protein